MRRIPIALLLVAAWALSRVLFAQPVPGGGAREFKVDDAWGRDSVQFRVTAPLEEIVGTTNQVTGVLRADLQNLAGPTTAARIEVRLTSLKTGIDMRDAHVARALGAEKNPVAVFTLEKIKSASANSLESNVPVNVVGEGIFELNGVRKKMEVAARLTYVPRGTPFNQMRPGSFVRLTAEFDVTLADLGVERSGPVLPLQVGETAHVTVSVLASDATPEEMKEYRERAVKYMGKART